MPGGYDRLAVPLSALAQMLGAAGLVIVPFGALWLAAERLPRLASWRFAFAVLTLIITTVVWALTSIVAAIQSGVAPGFARVGRGAARKIWPVLTGLRDASEERTHALPIYLVFVPIAVALTNHAGGEWTRDLLPVRRSPPMAVPVGAGPSFGIPKPLFQTHVPPGVTAYRTHSVPSRDGQRFLVNVATDAVASPITVVFNWTALLNK